MTREEHLLVQLAEECAEVAQRCAKALRFGMDEVQEGQTLTNHARISEEMDDLMAVYQMLNLRSISTMALHEKRKKVEKYLAYAREIGTLSP